VCNAYKQAKYRVSPWCILKGRSSSVAEGFSHKRRERVELNRKIVMKSFLVLRAVSVETGRFLLEHIRTPKDCVAEASWRRLDAVRCLGMASWHFTAGKCAMISHVLVDVVFTLPDFTVDMCGFIDDRTVCHCSLVSPVACQLDRTLDAPRRCI